VFPMKSLRSARGFLAALKSEFAAVAILVFTFSCTASAALGGDATSVLSDQARMKGTLHSVQKAAYAVHEITASTGTVVREYVSPTGKVFGVAWQGPFVPDLQQLLGTYFEQYSVAAESARETHVGRRPLFIQQPGLVVQTGGHMRSYTGRAYVPEMLPQGVIADAIR
jgi:uncharacterized protein DUF2844